MASWLLVPCVLVESFPLLLFEDAWEGTRTDSRDGFIANSVKKEGIRLEVGIS